MSSFIFMLCLQAPAGKMIICRRPRLTFSFSMVNMIITIKTNITIEDEYIQQVKYTV